MNPHRGLVFALFSLTAAAQGQTWTPTGSPATNWTSIACSANGSKLAAAGSGLIYLSTNSGITWTPASSPAEGSVVACSADGNRLIAGGSDAYISTNSGLNWVASGSGIPNWVSLACSADGLTVVGSASPFLPFETVMFTSSDGGLHWATTDAPEGYWWSVACSADGKTMFAAGAPQIYASTNGGAHWFPFSFTNAWTSVACSADGTKVVASAQDAAFFPGGLYTTTNSGATWLGLTNYFFFDSGWGPVASSADGAKLIACSRFLSPGLYTSTNLGFTWSQEDAPPTNYPAMASSADGAKLFAAANGGMIFSATSVRSPELSISRQNTNVVLSWLVPSLDFALQQTIDPGSTNWNTVGVTPTLTNDMYQVTLPASNAFEFYRLQH